MAIVIVLVIILICTACLHLKGSASMGFASIIAALCSGFVAFGYFELLAGFFINKKMMIPWANAMSFLILFGLIFLVLEALIILIVKKELDLGFFPERIGRIVCGIFLGFIVSGLLITALSMAPLSPKSPYQRFNPAKLNPENPSKGALNADGFVTGWFSMASSGSLSGKQSFAAIHPDFLDQTFLTKLGAEKKIRLATNPKAIEVPQKDGVWPAPQNLKNADDPNETIEPRPGHTLMIVHLGKTRASNGVDGSHMTLSQLRLICKQKDLAAEPFVGKAKNVYPIGYMKTAELVKLMNLDALMKTKASVKLKKGEQEAKTTWIDFVFNVPNGYVPVLAEFRLDNIVKLSKPLTAENAPEITPFNNEELAK